MKYYLCRVREKFIQGQIAREVDKQVIRTYYFPITKVEHFILNRMNH